MRCHTCAPQELAALWCAADEAPGMSRSMREAAAAIESIFVAAPGRVGNILGPVSAPDPRDSVENWDEAAGSSWEAAEGEQVRACVANVRVLGA